MRAVIYLVSVNIFCASCWKQDDGSHSEGVLVDTIYFGDFIWRQNVESKRFTVMFDNGRDREKPIFKLNEENLLRIRVKRLTEYELYPSEIVGAEIVKVDTSFNLFLVTPRDTSFSFVINQYYPKGRVIRCDRNWNIETNDYDEQLTPQNGFRHPVLFIITTHLLGFAKTRDDLFPVLHLN